MWGNETDRVKLRVGSRGLEEGGIALLAAGAHPRATVIFSPSASTARTSCAS